MHNDYLSSMACGPQSCHNLFIQPYKEAKENILKSLDSTIAYGRRFKHLVAGVLLAIPVVNTIALLALRRFSQVIQNQENEGREIPVEPLIDLNIENRDVPLNQMTTPESNSTIKSYSDFIAANSSDIVQLSKSDPTFGLKFVTSNDTSGLTDAQRLEVFSIIYPTVQEAIESDTLSKDEVKALAYFLLQYKGTVAQDFMYQVDSLFNTLKNHTKLPDLDLAKKTNYQHKFAMIEVVVLKYLLQGVYNEGVVAVLEGQGEEWFNDIFDTEQWTSSLAFQIANQGFDADINEQVDWYISLIPQENPKHWTALIKVGISILNEENYLPALKYFMQVASADVSKVDPGLVLEGHYLAAALAAIHVENLELNKAEIVSRREEKIYQSMGYTVRDLNFEECVNLSLESIIDLAKETQLV